MAICIYQSRSKAVQALCRRRKCYGDAISSIFGMCVAILQILFRRCRIWSSYVKIVLLGATHDGRLDGIGPSQQMSRIYQYLVLSTVSNQTGEFSSSISIVFLVWYIVFHKEGEKSNWGGTNSFLTVISHQRYPGGIHRSCESKISVSITLNP